jgi:hypothetical protein
MRNLLRMCVAGGAVALALSAPAVMAAPAVGHTTALTQKASGVHDIAWRRVCDRHEHHCRRVWVRDHRHWRDYH